MNPEKEIVGQIRVIKIKGNRAVGKIRVGFGNIKKGHTVSLEQSSGNYIGNRVMKRRENKVLINTYKLAVTRGDILTIFAKDNIEIGEIKIIKVGKNKAIGKIINESKRIAPGHIVENSRKYFEKKHLVIKGESGREKEKDDEEAIDAKKGKKINLKFYAAYYFLGFTMAELDIRLGNSITLGPTITMIDLTVNEIELSGTMYGIRGNYYFNKKAISTGWILGATAGIVSLEATFLDPLIGEYVTSSISGSYVFGLLSYQWVWKNLNFSLGAGK